MLKRLLWGTFALAIASGCSGSKTKEQTTGRAGAGPDRCECPLDWQVDNLAVCVGQHTAFTETLLYSSSLENGKPVCEVGRSFPQPLPKRAWSAQRIASPCTGQGTLVLRVRQGEADDPKADDCVIAEQRLDFDYSTKDDPLTLPSLDAWSAQDQACARAYEEQGGYLEFRVQSDEVGCGDDGVSTRYVNQCPVLCDTDPDAPGCEDCGQATLTNSF